MPACTISCINITVLYTPTAPDDYQRNAIPTNFLLSTFEFIQCLNVPTPQNNDGGNVMESFLINVTRITAVPSSIPVDPLMDSVIMVTLFEVCLDGDVRLIDGNSSMQGRVQMCFDGVFGTVCDTGEWAMQDAEVVCLQLGFVPLIGQWDILCQCRVSISE